MKARECFIKDDVVYIPLQDGTFAFVDVCDFDLVKKYNWHKYTNGKGNTSYVKRDVRKNKKLTSLSLHRVILGVLKQKCEVDHKNRNGLDNRRSNLRICTRSENMGNIQHHRKSKMLYKGVSYRRDGNRIKRWMSKITVNYKYFYLGSYLTEIEAAVAYDKAALKHFGDFACVNFESSRLQETKDDTQN